MKERFHVGDIVRLDLCFIAWVRLRIARLGVVLNAARPNSAIEIVRVKWVGSATAEYVATYLRLYCRNVYDEDE